MSCDLWPVDSEFELDLYSTYTSKIFKIRPILLKLLCGNQFEYMSCDLWPADSEFELDLYFSVIYLHIKNIQNPSNIFEVIVRKPIWIYIWAVTFDLWTLNSNLTCILVSSTYTSKIFKIRPILLKLLCGNQFEYIMSCDLWPADSEFELDLYFSVIYLHIQNIQNPSNIFEVIVRKPIWIYNELWPLTFDLRTLNSNLTCILVSSTYIIQNIQNLSNIFEVIVRK